MDPLHPRSLPGGVKDAWSSLVKSADVLEEGMEEQREIHSGGITANMIANELAKNKAHKEEDYSLTKGQLGGACRSSALKASLDREAELDSLLAKEMVEEEGSGEGSKVLEDAWREIRMANVVTSNQSEETMSVGCWELMNSFYSRLKQVKEYHAKEGEGDAAVASTQYQDEFGATMPGEQPMLSGHKRKHGHPIADGYDIASLVATETRAVRSGEVFSLEESFGKYLDLVRIYDEEVRGMRHAFASETNDSGEAETVGAPSVVSYLEFLTILSNGLNTSISEQAKLRDRRKYARFLSTLENYLVDYLQRTSPFLDVKEVIEPSIEAFEKEWSEMGGVVGWECKIAEASMVRGKENTNSDENAASTAGIDLSKYTNATELENNVSADKLKSELARLGLKCGGTPKDRAARLFVTKDTPLDQLPAKLFAKGKKSAATEAATQNAMINSSSREAIKKPNGQAAISDSRVDIARVEAVVLSLLDQLRPILDGTRRRIERRSIQTDHERDQEIYEEINGSQDDTNQLTKKQKDGDNGNDSADEDSEDDTPIYNPKNVPLDWNGKPIPYWLFKLHGLNHFYPCEICGNESYRGRRNFEKHFTESRHAYGMRCLGIPNTKHFHGVTKIEDAQELWSKLKSDLEENQFDGDEEEEYEDSHGNVLNRSEYEDLARKGML